MKLTNSLFNGGGASLGRSPQNKEKTQRRVEEKDSSISSFSCGFTLVELLAVIAILAIILLIAVPSILGVIEEAKVKSFKLSVLGIMDAVELEYAVNGTTGGEISKLPMNPNPFTEGNWSINEDTGEIIITDVTDGQYEVNHVTNKDGEDFDVNKNGEPVITEITINGKNPDTVSCSATESYQDQGAKYKDQNLTTTDTVNLVKAGTYLLKYQYEKYHATRVVNVTNTNQPTLNINETAVTITKGDQFDPSIYIESASDPCEGDITEKVQSVSSVNTDIGGTYTVTYKVKNLGNTETTKTLTVTVLDLSAPVPVFPQIPAENGGWFIDKPVITLPENPNIDSYEYAISTDGGITWGEYKPVTGDRITIDVEGDNIYIKIRGKRGDKYTDPVIKGPFKIDTTTPGLTPKGNSHTVVVGDSYEVTNLYTESFGASGGNTVCKVGSKIVTNLNSLALGTHTLICTATSGVGKVSNTISITITITNPYLVDVVKVGDFINYDAGNWSATAALPTTGGSFGGYTSGTSKNSSVSCSSYFDNQYSGWRVLSKSGSGVSGTVTLVHAGTPECYCSGTNAADGVVKLNARASSQYINTTYANSARSITCSDLKPFDSDVCTDFLMAIPHDLIMTQTPYLLAQTSNSELMWGISADGFPANSMMGDIAIGIRPVVILKAKVQKIGGTGGQTTPYQISIN